EALAAAHQVGDAEHEYDKERQVRVPRRADVEIKDALHGAQRPFLRRLDEPHVQSENDRRQRQPAQPPLQRLQPLRRLRELFPCHAHTSTTYSNSRYGTPQNNTLNKTSICSQPPVPAQPPSNKIASLTCTAASTTGTSNGNSSTGYSTSPERSCAATAASSVPTPLYAVMTRAVMAVHCHSGPVIVWPKTPKKTGIMTTVIKAINKSADNALAKKTALRSTGAIRRPARRPSPRSLPNPRERPTVPAKNSVVHRLAVNTPSVFIAPGGSAKTNTSISSSARSAGVSSTSPVRHSRRKSFQMIASSTRAMLTTPFPSHRRRPPEPT